MTSACDHCRYFHRRTNPTEATTESLPGECRRHAPQLGELVYVGIAQEDYGLGVFPKVLAHDWCGDFVQGTAASH